VEQSPSSKAKSHSTSQKFSIFYGPLKFITVITSARLWPCVTFCNKLVFRVRSC